MRPQPLLPAPLLPPSRKKPSALPAPTTKQLESALVRAAREEGAAREAELQGELAAAQAAARDQLEKAARQRRMHER